MVKMKPKAPLMAFSTTMLLLLVLGGKPVAASKQNHHVIQMGSLTDFLFVMLDGHEEAEWEGDHAAYGGDVVVNGAVAKTGSGKDVAYGGTIHTSGSRLGDDWDDHVVANMPREHNHGQAFVKYNQEAVVDKLKADFEVAMAVICDLQVTTGYENYNVEKNGDGVLDFEDEKNDLIVIDVDPSGMTLDGKYLQVKADEGDLIIFRWGRNYDETTGTCTYDLDKVEFKDGGGVIPHPLSIAKGFGPDRMIHAAGNIKAGGGSAPTPEGLAKFPTYGPENLMLQVTGSEADWNAGAYFVGYWLTIGKDDGTTEDLDSAAIIGGWYSTTIKFKIKNGGGGVHVKNRFADNNFVDVDVLCECNGLDNPCFEEDTHSLAAISIRNTVESVIIKVAEENYSPAFFETDVDNPGRRGLRGAQDERRLPNIYSYCPSQPWMCEIRRGRRRRLADEFTTYGVDDSTVPIKKEHFTMESMVAHHGFTLTPHQRSCVANSACTLTYYMFPK